MGSLASKLRDSEHTDDDLLVIGAFRGPSGYSAYVSSVESSVGETALAVLAAALSSQLGADRVVEVVKIGVYGNVGA